MAWSSEAFIAKARCYIERGLEATDETVRAWWFHFAVEPLVRATVAAIHPALLADPRHVDSLLSAVSTEEAIDEVVRSRAITDVLELATRAPSFHIEVKEAAARLILRRNVECHGPTAAFANQPEDTWMPDFLRVAGACCTATRVDLASLVGQGYASQASDLADAVQKEVRAEVLKLLAEAKTRDKKDAPSPDWNLIEKTDGTVVWVVACPACGEKGQMSGARVYVAAARFDGDQLSHPVTIAGRRFSCAHCGLELKGRAHLAAAGLPATIRTSEALDPYETLDLDPAEVLLAQGLQVIDPSDFEYQDE